MAQLALFTEQVGTWPYPTPCPIRDTCPNNPTGCAGEVGFCNRAQLAAGRYITRETARILGGHYRKLAGL